MSRTIACAVDFILDALDYSPEETSIPETPDEVHEQPSANIDAGGMLGSDDLYAVVLWNDEKHSFNEVSAHVSDITSCSRKESMALAEAVDYEVRVNHSQTLDYNSR